jgi:ribonuclease R
VNVNAAKSTGTLGAKQSKAKSTLGGQVNKAVKSAPRAGKPAGTKPPVRNTKARRK